MVVDLMVEGGNGRRVTKIGSLVSSDVPLVRSKLGSVCSRTATIAQTDASGFRKNGNKIEENILIH